LDFYVDESGDLGFSEKSTKFFVVAYMATSSSATIRTEMKRLLRRFHEKRVYHRKQNELKFCRMNDYCRRKVLQKIVQFDDSFGAIVVEKKYVKEHLRAKLAILYNWIVVHNIVSALIPNLEAGQKIHITFDKSLPKARITEFNHYVREKASYLFFEKGSCLPENCLESNHIASELEPCLQAVDAIAGAYFHKCEKANSCYVDIIGDAASSVYLWRK
jgi:hypothetical protein